MVFYFQHVYSQDHPYSIALSGSITTTSRLYVNPYSTDQASRNQSLTIDGIWGIGIDIRRDIQGNHLSAGLSTEYLGSYEEYTIEETSGTNITPKDGYIAIPVELTGYFSIPLGTETFHMYIGGGIGVYFGERRYQIAGLSSHIVERKPVPGIHVVSGFEFDITSILFLRTELKFRDVQFETSNVFTPDQSYPGVTLPHGWKPFTSRVSIDGILINTGIAFRF